MLILIVLAVYAYIGLEAWTHSRAARREVGTFRGFAADLSALEATPIEPLRLPSFAAPFALQPRLALAA